MKPLQNLGHARSKGLSRRRALLHRGPKQSGGNPNFTAAIVIATDPAHAVLVAVSINPRVLHRDRLAKYAVAL